MELYLKAENRVIKLDRQLENIGVDRYEPDNYLIVKDESDPDGFQIVFIDTEYWSTQ
jgi:hypothetical protein